MKRDGSEQKAADKIARLVDVANRVPAIAWMLGGWDRTFVLTVDGRNIGIVTSGGRAEVLLTPPGAVDVRFGLTERTLDALIAGRMSPLGAKLSGRLRSEGNIPDILRFASVFTACLNRAGEAEAYSTLSLVPRDCGSDMV